MSVAVNVKRLFKVYRGTENDRASIEVMRDFNLEVEKGSFTVLHGPNGCGKSTLLYILAGVEDYDSGEIHILGQAPESSDVGIVFQNYSATLFPWLDIADNVFFSFRGERPSKAKRRGLVKSFVDSIGLTEIPNYLETYPYRLSGGQQQMTAIARALFTEPPIVLFDEPFSALDTRHKNEVLLRIQQFCKQRDITCLFAIHDLDEAILMADRLLVLGPRPMHIKGSISVQFERPRTQTLLKSETFFELKRRALEIIENTN